MQLKYLCLYSFFLLSVLASSIDRHKRDVLDLHHSGGTKTTTTLTTARPTTQPTASPYPAASSDPGKWDQPSSGALSPFTIAVIYGGNHITPENGVLAGILIVLGLYLIVFGFRSFRLTLAVGGFVTFGKLALFLCLVWLNVFRSHHLGGHDQQSTVSRLYEQQYHHDRRTGRTGSLGCHCLCPLLVHLDLPDGGRGWIGLGSLYLVL